MRLQYAATLCAALVLVGCGSPDSGNAPADNASTDNEPTAAPAEVTPSDAADLTARAVERACDLHCGEFRVFVRSEIITATTPTGAGEPMPQLVKEAIAQRIERAEFITENEEAELVVDGNLADPTTAVVYVGPLADLENDVVGIDIGVLTSNGGSRFETHQFLWTGSEWNLTSEEETGVTVTTAVS